jgi:hypothetical protein
MSLSSKKEPRRKALIVGLLVATLVLAGTSIYLEIRGPSTSYIDGYNFAVAFTHGSRQPRMRLTRLDAHSSCSVWSFSNAGGVSPGDVPREWRQGCEAALTSGAYSTIGK